jgi:hypothetical protein
VGENQKLAFTTKYSSLFFRRTDLRLLPAIAVAADLLAR